MNIIDKDGTDVLCIQEPYVTHNKIAGIPRKHKIYVSGEGRPRAAIVITNTQIDSLLLRQLSDEDTVVLEVVYNKFKTVIASMYLDINRRIEDDLNKIEAIIQHAIGAGVIIALDSNSRSSSWHDTQTNTRGRILEEYFASKNLHVMNEESDLTTYSTRQGSSNIDLTVINNQLLRDMVHWEICEEESCSDHNIIKFRLGHDINHDTEYRYKGFRYIVTDETLKEFDYNLSRFVAMKFRTGQESSLNLDRNLAKQAKELNDIENAADLFQEALVMSCNKSFKIRQTSNKPSKHKSVPWWTKELTVMRKRVNALRRRFQRTANNDYLRESRKNQYHVEKTKYQAAIKTEKIRSWKQFCNLTSKSNPWNAVYKLATNKTSRSQTMTTIQKPDGSLTTNINETVTYMLDYLITKDVEDNDTDYHKEVRTLAEQPIQTEDDREYTPEEIGEAIGAIKCKKAPGEDGITGDIFQRAYKQFPHLINTLYNECLRQGCFPKIWKRVKVLPITKPGKEDTTDPSKFRPISLINVGGKVLEKILISRIMHHAHTNNHLNKNQYGFTPKKSTTDATMAVKEFVEDGLREGLITILVSLDVKGAFDAAWWPSILKALREFNCPRNLYYLSKSYFSQRTAVLSTNSFQAEKEVTKGCPQGSCCGPGYWTIQYNSLLNLEFTKNTKAIAFADDLLIAVKAESIRKAENITNMEMNKIQNWAKNNKINFNEQKSKAMVITRRKRKENKEISIYMNNKPLVQVQKIKYLGIILDSKLKFREHIMYIASKCTKLIHALSKSAKLSWGLSHEAMYTIYKGAILPLLLYGVPVWINALEKECNKTVYNRVQRLINIKIAKAFRTTSNEALCTVTGITPIVIKAEEVAKIYNIMRNTQAYEIDHEVQPRNWLHPADTVRITEQPEENDIEIYTDGSKNEHGVGAGIALFIQSELSYQLRYTLHNRCSNNQAEQLAIIKALETLGKLHIKSSIQRTVTIYTDSKITLQSLKNTKNHNYLIEEIRKKVTALEKCNWTIIFTWIKAHIGIYGNELADRLAKEAARNNDISFDRIPKSTIIQEVQEQSMAKWQIQWDHTTKGATTKQFFPNLKDRLTTNIKLTPNFTAIVTAHGKTKAYLHRFKIIDSPECSCNGENQTVEHLIFVCAKLQTEREELIYSIAKQDNWPVKKSDLVKKYIKQFIKFVNSIDFGKL
jgi:ribonuclease HI